MTQRRIWDTDLRVTDEGADSGTRRVPEKTVLIVVRGMSLAKEFRVTITQRPMTFNQDLKALFPSSKLDSEFLFYYLLSQHDAIRDSATEASHGTKKLETSVLLDWPLPIPPHEQQRAVVSILSAYDDAIENSRRRIKLLEDAARHLYEEWFVRLRFPGHERVRIKDGVPDGWAIRKLGDLCEEKSGIQTGPFGSQLHQSDYTDQGVPVVMPRDLATLRISEAEIARIPEALADRLSRHQMQTGDIVYGRRGDIGRRALVLGRQRGYLCGTGCLRLRPRKSRIEPTFLFHALGSLQTQGAIRNRAHGATMPNLSAKLMASIPVHIPARQLRTLFAEYAGGIAETVDILDRQIAKLGVARDFLLPRLMSGKIAA